MTDVVALAQSSAHAEDFEAEVLRGLVRDVGADVAFFSVRGREGSPTVAGLDARVIGRAVDHGSAYAEELLPVKRAALAARGVAVDTDVLGERRKEKRYFREVAALVGGRHSLLAYLSFRGKPFGLVMLGRTGAAFSARDVARVEALVPALGVARAAFGLPYATQPLSAPSPGLLARLGLRDAERRAFQPGARAHLAVLDRGGYRELVASAGAEELVWTRAALDDPARSGWPYVELFHVAAALATERRRALLIGCGGGVIVHQFARTYPGLAIDLVECDPVVVELARRFFGLGAVPGVTAHVGDGAEFVAGSVPGFYDLCVVDAFDARGLDDGLASPAFFRGVARALAPGGALAFNVIGALAGPGPVRRVVAAMRSGFADLRLVPVMTPDERYAPETPRNVVVVARSPRA